MAGRGYDLNNAAYRYGFNGKENDNEVKGAGSQQDYGMRIYDPRIGKFLSVDPLAKDYSFNSPYSYAMNRVIDGIDIDGLEYIKADEARIGIYNGDVVLKVENFNWISKRLWQSANNNEKNWTPGEIGISKTIGNIQYVQPLPSAESPSFHDKDDDPGHNPSSHRVENPVARSTGQADKRYKEREINGASPRMSAGGKGALAVAIINTGIEYGILGAGMYEEHKIKNDLESLNSAIMDVRKALKIKGLIPKENRNIKDLSTIVNVVLQGENISGNKKLTEIGLKIFNTISTPQKEKDKK